MRAIEIRRRSDDSTYSVSISRSGFVVTAADSEDAAVAEAAQKLIAGRWKRDAYSPSMGEPLAVAAAMAASIIGGNVVTEIEGGSGELEQTDIETVAKAEENAYGTPKRKPRKRKET
jgi:hypothetical protein